MVNGIRTIIVVVVVAAAVVVPDTGWFLHDISVKWWTTMIPRFLGWYQTDIPSGHTFRG
jgi:hypothetical protein